MNELMYSFRNNNVRVLEKEGEPWFVAKDVCEVLGLVNTSRSLERLKDYEKGIHTMNTLRGLQKLSLINESGLYALIFTSRKEEAEDFRCWVTSEVLPSIRKRGVYATEDFTKKALEDPQFMIDALTALKKEREEKAKLELEKEINKPKVLFAECVEDSDSTILIGDFSKILKQNGVDIGQNRLFKYLRENGYLIKRGDKHYPSQKSMNLNIFRLIERTINTPKGTEIVPTVKVTGKGQVYLTNKFLKEIK